MWKPIALILLSAGVLAADSLPRTPSPDGARVYLIAPADGAELTSPITVQFGLHGMGVAPAGVAVANTGHHHLLVDVAALPSLDQPLPKDEHHLHFGAGQTETTLKLAPGKHTLQLILGDQLHIPHQPPLLSEKISIVVR
ncbi:MAG: DUF4399 domain-containing protein [Lysobacterales bacterium]